MGRWRRCFQRNTCNLQSKTKPFITHWKRMGRDVMILNDNHKPRTYGKYIASVWNREKNTSIVANCFSKSCLPTNPLHLFSSQVKQHSTPCKKILPFAALTVGELWVKHPLVGASRFGQHLSNIAAATEDLAEAMWRKETCIVKTQKQRNAKTIKTSTLNKP